MMMTTRVVLLWEAFVIWGSLEVPKLFANSYISQKLLKGADPILK
jgi:hypothetical protein